MPTLQTETPRRALRIPLLRTNLLAAQSGNGVRMSDTSTRQIKPVGVRPTVPHLLLAALMFSTPSEVLDVAEHLEADDFVEPARAVFESVIRLASQSTPPSCELVFDDLRRHGKLTRQRGTWLASAMPSGACSTTARQYAAALVAETLRRQTESFGAALRKAAEAAAEIEVARLADTAASRIRATSKRLASLRGETPNPQEMNS